MLVNFVVWWNFSYYPESNFLLNSHNHSTASLIILVFDCTCVTVFCSHMYKLYVWVEKLISIFSAGRERYKRHRRFKIPARNKKR